MSDYAVLGSADSSENKAWEDLINAFEDGYQGLERLATSVFASLDTQDWVNDYKDDLIQDGVCEVFLSVGSWEQDRHPGPWAATVMKYKMMRKLSTTYRRLDEPVDPGDMAPLSLKHDDGILAVEQQQIIQRVRDAASPADQALIDKILRDEPLDKADRQRWSRFQEKMKR